MAENRAPARHLAVRGSAAQDPRFDRR